MGLTDRIKHGWNAFRSWEDKKGFQDTGQGSGNPGHKQTRTIYNRVSVAKTIFSRIATDVSMTEFRHVKIVKDTEDEEIISSDLHNCLNVEANIDQSYISFIHDIVYSMFDEGVVAVVPTNTTINPEKSGSYDIETMRVGKITQWFPKHVEVRLYDERDGRYKDIRVEKQYTAIIENPFYDIVNRENSTLKRLLRAMSLSDSMDETAAQDKFDMIIQLPYAIKSDLQKQMAKDRMQSLQEQLSENKYGIAQIDATEKITQLNRPLISNHYEKVKDLRDEFYNQMGLTPKIFDGTASEIELRIYYSRTIDPIVMAIAAEFTRKFLTKTARIQGQKVTFYRNPFKLVPVEQLADIADKFSRNAILTPNEIRKIVGYGPDADPNADKLINRNIAGVNQLPEQMMETDMAPPPPDTNQNGF